MRECQKERAGTGWDMVELGEIRKHDMGSDSESGADQAGSPVPSSLAKRCAVVQCTSWSVLVTTSWSAVSAIFHHSSATGHSIADACGWTDSRAYILILWEEKLGSVALVCMIRCKEKQAEIEQRSFVSRPTAPLSRCTKRRRALLSVTRS